MTIVLKSEFTLLLVGLLITLCAGTLSERDKDIVIFNIAALATIGWFVVILLTLIWAF